MRPRLFVLTFVFLTMLILPFSTSTALANDPVLPPGLCFNETGKCVRGLFYAHWVGNGGLARQGFPLTDEFNEVSKLDGKTYRVQYFERARFEYHPEKVNTPFVVQLGLLGKEQFAARYPEGKPTTGGTDEGCFAETNTCAKGAFYDYWVRNGGLAQFGFPISDEFVEFNPVENKAFLVQYFERARYELHAFGDGSFLVLLGLLGREQFTGRYPNGQPDDSGLTVEPVNVYAGALTTEINPKVANVPPRVYVPNETGGTITVIDPNTLEVIDRFGVGSIPHHVAPDYDMSRLYVNNMGSSTLSIIDPYSGRVTGAIPTPVPYNLYFTTDGTKAIVAAEPINTLNFYDTKTWQLLRSLPIPWSGVDHMDMSADGTYLLVGTEFSGVVVKVSTVTMSIVSAVNLGGLTIDVRIAPDGAVFYVANQSRHGVHVVDPVTMREVEFIPTGTGAHGFHVSRDSKHLYTANRLNGTISVIDFATRKVVDTWVTGGSPDMLQISPDGKQLWASGRFHNAVYVVDTTTGNLIKSIPVGVAPHGLCYFPQPGRISIGHNGVYR